MRQKYASARNIMDFVGIVGWVAFAAGLIVLVMGISKASQTGAIGVGAGISIAIGGLIQVAMAQVSVAILDMADNSREALALQRAIAENAGISQAVAPTPALVTAVNDKAAGQTPGKRENVTIYMGEEIEKEGNRYHWKGQKFLTLGKAKAAIKLAKGNSA